MKVRLGRGKERQSLRPLTEKEIQRKLYGGYLESFRPVKEEPALRWSEPPKNQKTRTAVLKKKIRISIPWKKITSSLAIAFKVCLSATKVFVSRVATGWGLGAVVVVLLFIGIHNLNTYRTAAMKASKPKRPEVVERAFKREPPAQERKSPLQPATPERSQTRKREELLPSLVPVPPVLNVAKEPPPSPPTAGPEKPYVIQVCTYGNEKDSNRLVGQMKQAGLPAFSRSLSRPNGRTFYLVFLGRFETFREAQAKLKEFRSQAMAKQFPDSFVREF